MATAILDASNRRLTLRTMKTTFANNQLAMMSAHLVDLAGIALRGGDIAKGSSLLEYAACLLTEEGPEDIYRESLLEAGLSREVVAASLANITAGKHPADSVPGRLAIYRDKAEREGDGRPHDVDGRRSRCWGEVHALKQVLDLLGCEEIRT